jgi:hypothetical protein
MVGTGDSAFAILNFLFAVSFRMTRFLLEAVGLVFFRADIFLGESGGRLD